MNSSSLKQMNQVMNITKSIITVNPLLIYTTQSYNLFTSRQLKSQLLYFTLSSILLLFQMIGLKKEKGEIFIHPPRDLFSFFFIVNNLPIPIL